MVIGSEEDATNGYTMVERERNKAVPDDIKLACTDAGSVQLTSGGGHTVQLDTYLNMIQCPGVSSAGGTAEFVFDGTSSHGVRFSLQAVHVMTVTTQDPGG